MHTSTQLHVFIGHATEDWCRVTRESDSWRLRHPPEPSSTHRCERSKARKMGAQRPRGRSVKNRLNTAINPSSRHEHRKKIAVSARLDPGRAQTGISTTLSKRQQQLRNLCSFLHSHDQDAVGTTTAMSTTLSWNWTPRRPAQQGHRPPCQSTTTAGPSQFSAL